MTEGNSVAAEDLLAARYWSVVDELPLMDLREKETKIFRSILDEQFRTRQPFIRLTQKQDLTALTLIEKQNLGEPVKTLIRRGMLNTWETSSGWCFQAIMEIGFWNPRPSEIDRRVYYQALSGLRTLNRYVDPDPALPTLEEPKGLAEALSEITNFVPMRSAQEVMPKGTASARDYHQDRGSSGDARLLQGDIRESAPGNAIQAKGAVPPVSGGTATFPEVKEVSAQVQSSSDPTSWVECNGSVACVCPKCRKARRAQIEADAARWRDGTAEAVLDLSTGEVETAVSGGPPEYLNQVLGRGGVLNSITHSSMINDQCNDSDLNQCSLAMFIERLRRGEVVLDRGASPATLGKWLRMAGAFSGPPGTYWARKWLDRCNKIPRGVENAFLAAVEKARVEGPQTIRNLGGWMTKDLTEKGWIKEERRR